MAAGFSLVAGGGRRDGLRAGREDGARPRSGIEPLALEGGEEGVRRSYIGPDRLPAPRCSTLSEMFAASARDSGWIGLLLARLAPGPVLWVQERMAILEAGRLYPPGLERGGDGAVTNLIHVETRDARDALWAMEEGLRCGGLSAVIGEIWGDPAALDFTATRRLAVAAERHGVAAYLVRLGGQAGLSGARMRWRVASAPSLAHPFDPRAPGAAAWDCELFRARGAAPGRWTVAHEPARAIPLATAEARDHLDLAAEADDRTLGQAGGVRRAG